MKYIQLFIQQTISMKKQSFFSGVLILLVGSVIAKGLGAIYRIPLTWILGVEGLGVYQLVFPIFSLVLVLSSTGMPAGISKMIALRKDNVAEINRILKVSVIALSVIGLVFGLILFFCAGLIAQIQGNSIATLPYMAIAPAVVLVSVLSAFRGYFQGRMNMIPTSMSNIFEQFFKLIFGLALSFLFVPQGIEYGVLGAVLGITLSELVAVGYMFLSYAIDKKKEKKFYNNTLNRFSKSNENKKSVSGIEKLQINSATIINNLTSQNRTENSLITEVTLNSEHNLKDCKNNFNNSNSNNSDLNNSNLKNLDLKNLDSHNLFLENLGSNNLGLDNSNKLDLNNLYLDNLDLGNLGSKNLSQKNANELNSINNLNNLNNNVGSAFVDTKSNKELLKELFKTAFPIVIATIILPFSLFVDSLLVVNLLNSSGWTVEQSTILWGIDTGIVTSIVNLPVVLTLSVATAVIPSLVSDIAQRQRRVREGMLISCNIAFPCALGVMVLAPQIVQFLYNGTLINGIINEELIASQLLSFSALLIILTAILQTQNASLQGLGYSNVPIFNMSIAFVVKTLLILALVMQPTLNIFGVAIAKYSFFLIAVILNGISLYKKSKFSLGITKEIMVMGISSITMAFALFVFNNFNFGLTPYVMLPLEIFLGVIVYVGSFMCLLPNKNYGRYLRFRKRTVVKQ